MVAGTIPQQGVQCLIQRLLILSSLHPAPLQQVILLEDILLEALPFMHLAVSVLTPFSPPHHCPFSVCLLHIDVQQASVLGSLFSSGSEFSLRVPSVHMARMITCVLRMPAPVICSALSWPSSRPGPCSSCSLLARECHHLPPSHSRPTPGSPPQCCPAPQPCIASVRDPTHTVFSVPSPPAPLPPPLPTRDQIHRLFPGH